MFVLKFYGQERLTKKEMASSKYFKFLDTAVDVYFGITLFTLFLSFPGWQQVSSVILFFHLMLFFLFTWWELRTIEQIPKHYFIDFILIGLSMFALTQAINELDNIRAYVGWLLGFLLIDMASQAIDWWVHRPRRSEQRFLRFFLIDDGVLSAFYILALLLIDELSIFSAIAISLPFIISTYLSILFRTTELRAKYIV